jgi:hypothetical protein
MDPPFSCAQISEAEALGQSALAMAAIATSYGLRRMQSHVNLQVMTKGKFALALMLLAVPALAEVDESVPVVSREDTEQAFKDLNQNLEEARMVPNFENGQPAGYRRYQPVDGSKLDQLGLKSGEVISVEHNGVAAEPEDFAAKPE